MDQREFNRSMDSYIRDRKSKRSRATPTSSSSGGFFTSLKEVFTPSERPEQVVEVPDTVPVEDVEAVIRGESAAEPLDDDFDEEAFVEANKPKGFWGSLKEAIFGSYDEKELMHEDEVEVTVVEKPGEIDDDVKELLRTCVSWVNRLPAEEIDRIKRSGEYELFKEMLRKYKLLKE